MVHFADSGSVSVQSFDDIQVFWWVDGLGSQIGVRGSGLGLRYVQIHICIYIYIYICIYV